MLPFSLLQVLEKIKPEFHSYDFLVANNKANKQHNRDPNILPGIKVWQYDLDIYGVLILLTMGYLYYQNGC